jgi:hypothetical protein
MHSQSHSDRQQEIQSHDTEIGAFLRACALDGPRKVVLQATTLLSKWNYNAPDGTTHHHNAEDVCYFYQ